MSDRPFSVLGLQQIAVGSRDKSALRRLWLDLLGLHQGLFHDPARLRAVVLVFV